MILRYHDSDGHSGTLDWPRCVERSRALRAETSQDSHTRGQGDDDRRGQRDSRPPHPTGAVSVQDAARVGRAAGAQLTGPCQNGQSQAPATQQYPGGAHGAAGLSSQAPRATAGPVADSLLPSGGGSTPKARNADPQTAKDAAAAIAPHITPQQTKLLDAFRAHPSGLTAAAASEAAGVFYPSASTRITELEAKGLLVRTGETRRTPQGRNADVLVLSGSALTATGRNVAA